MMESLERQYELVGMHRSEIIKLLGTPDSESSIKLSYYLGLARFGIDSGSLSIIVDD